MANSRWQMWLSALVGVAVFIVPWLLGNAASTVAAPLSNAAEWNLWIVGGITAVLSLIALAEYRPWEEWASIVVGAWLVASPWIFGFTAATAMAWSVGIAGGVLIVLGIWALVANIGSRRYA